MVKSWSPTELPMAYDRTLGMGRDLHADCIIWGRCPAKELVSSSPELVGGDDGAKFPDSASDSLAASVTAGIITDKSHGVWQPCA